MIFQKFLETFPAIFPFHFIELYDDITPKI